MFDTSFARSGNLRLDRRKFMSAAASLVAVGVLPKAALALAAPYSFKHGNFDVTVISDGALVLPISTFPGANPEEIKALLGPMMKDGETARFEASPLLLKSAGDTILLDTGSGSGFQDSAGKIAESLKAAGVEPGAVTRVIFTHAHPDHCWGTVDPDGAPLFPNATLHMAEAEWNFWAAPDLAGKMPEAMRGLVTGTQAEFQGMKNKIAFFKPGSEVLPGINALDTAGHTPGHVSFELAGGDGLVVTGDSIVNPQIFFAHPDWKFGFDADPEAAIAARKKLLDMAAAGKKKLIGFHWAYPGIGHAEKADAAYRFVPAS
jgi:glyoxylase-like metal-dependent hydrolase (beta-lactamase superfamily II)